MIYSYTHPLKFPETDPLPTHLSELDFELLYVDVQHEEGEDFEADQGQRSTGHANKFRHVITLTSSILCIYGIDFCAQLKSILTAQQCSSYSLMQRRREERRKGEVDIKDGW